MTLSQFIENGKAGNKFIVACDGGYFAGETVPNCYLISNLAGAVIFDKLTAAVDTAVYSGTDAKAIEVKYYNQRLYIKGRRINPKTYEPI